MGLVLVRHGQSASNAAQALAGRIDAPLTELGRAQARLAGAALGDVVELRSSSLRRARETAELLDAGSPSIDDRFIEIDFGVHDGTPLSEVPPELWERFFADPSFRPEGGESLLDLEARVGEALEEAFSEGGPARREDGDLVVVSHVSPIKAAVALVLGASPLVTWRMHLDNATVTRIEHGARGLVLHSFNGRPALGSSVP
jgi:broad specificity phosphatase PhoE